jgi:hypothetical protein
MFEPRKDEVAGERRKLAKYNENYEVKEDEMGKECSTNVERRNAYRILVRRSEGKLPLRRPRDRWVNNIKIDLGETGLRGVDGIYLAQDIDKWRTLVNEVITLGVV